MAVNVVQMLTDQIMQEISTDVVFSPHLWMMRKPRRSSERKGCVRKCDKDVHNCAMKHSRRSLHNRNLLKEACTYDVS